MLTREDNILLTHVTPGTPLGRFLRRYWIPAAKLEEVSEPGGAPARVGLLGERLVAFRDPTGKVGLIREFCPHRCASLAYARNEEGGLRCIYHGWKISHDGCVLEMPAEPQRRVTARNKLQPAYPVREAGGLLWTYMGPPALEPPFPKFPWLNLPQEQLLVVKMYEDCNFLQGLEGDLDPAHPNFLHRDFQFEAGKSWLGAGWESVARLISYGAPTIYCEESPYLMRVGAVRTTDDPKTNYVRTAEWVAPFYAYIATGPHESQVFKAWLPIDDFSCYTFYVHFDTAKALDTASIYSNWGHLAKPPHYRTGHSLQNMHCQNRQRMASGNFSGIDGAAIQDRAVQESMGAICDRTKEHLVTSDKAIIFYRQLMLRKLADMDAGKPLPAQEPALDFQQRAASWYVPADEPWSRALWHQERFERMNPDGPAPFHDGIVPDYARPIATDER